MAERYQGHYTVTIGDINYGGHLGNEKALIVFQDARIHFFNHLGFSENDIGDGLGIIIVECAVSYLREVFLHDQLSVWIGVSELKKRKFVLQYEVEREPEKEPVLRGSTTFLVFNYADRNVSAMPERFKEKMLPFLSD
jgi:acyl-CoA thioester hydrolase